MNVGVLFFCGAASEDFSVVWKAGSEIFVKLRFFVFCTLYIMNSKSEQKKNAKEFVDYWKDKGYEKGESQPFWMSLLRDVLGVEKPEQHIIFEDQVKIDHTAFIDGIIPESNVLIEQKSRGKDLRKPIRQSDGTLLTPFQQAKRYSAELPYSKRPRWVITCNFSEFFIYDMERPAGEPEVIKLEELPKEAYRLNFIIDAESEILKREMEISIAAGDLVGVLYDALLKQYKDPTNEQSLRSLNVLCVRLIFLLYAEDAGILGYGQMFHDYLSKYDERTARQALINLFRVLDQKEEERDPYLPADLLVFPYVNGGLFADETIEIPTITEEILGIILLKASEGFDWSEISPAIFGAVFESTLNPETRRSGGMHYTSIENIHKVIDPLFLDDLNDEFKAIKNIGIEKNRKKKLLEFQNKLASLTFLDPACGSGNFLTETYVSLRRLENEVLIELTNGQIMIGEALTPIKVNLSQFYGIEINDFAVTVAKTALWIAESQMMQETESIVKMNLDFLPLKTNTNIIEGNALRMNWQEICPKLERLHIISNPPYLGYSLRNNEQTADLNYVAPEFSKKLDYVSGWYIKAAQLMNETDASIRVAYVSTNSITQGEQVALLWKSLMEEYRVHIDYAVQSFQWESEASQQAVVTCVIIGFSKAPNDKQKYIWSGDKKTAVNNITPYLNCGPTVFVESRTKPLCDVPKMRNGNRPSDGGNLIIEAKDYADFIKKEPKAAPFIKRFVGAEEFIHNKPRYCLWLADAEPSDIAKMPLVMDRVRKCNETRLKSSKLATRKCADTPYLFQEIRQPNGNYLVIPAISSLSRKYIPIGYLDASIIPSNTIQVIPDIELFHFGVLTSNVHMAWTRTVCGYYGDVSILYSSHLVYNNFPWPSPNEAQKKRIEETAQHILDVREKYLKDGKNNLADLYNDLLMPSDLREAHRANDCAVMTAYGFPIKITESECVAELMKMYERLTTTKK